MGTHFFWKVANLIFGFRPFLIKPLLKIFVSVGSGKCYLFIEWRLSKTMFNTYISPIVMSTVRSEMKLILYSDGNVFYPVSGLFGYRSGGFITLRLIMNFRLIT